MTITGPQIQAARMRLGWPQQELARKAKVAVTVVERAERSPGEPVITVSQMNALVQALRAAGADLAAASEGDETHP